MSELDRVWQQARSDLIVATVTGDADLFLWEHSSRIARAACAIARLECVQILNPNPSAVTAAALYHDAGWVARFHSGEIDRCEILVRPPSETHREHGALMMENRLAELMPREAIRRASLAIRSMDQRGTDSVEGRIVFDADNLDEFGPLALWPAIRRGALDGKGIQAVIDTWQRRKEYQFWSARLNDSFHFEPVRKIAKKRLAIYEGIVQEVECHLSIADLESAVDAEAGAEDSRTMLHR
ncbi:MAG: HD domain-containing protein [Planctomycetes bacterium]|nr:HD domain-containing protein [Planctomycetota bacterium]